MGGIFGGSHISAPPPPPPPPPNPPSAASATASATTAAEQQQIAAAAGAGFDNTLLTGGQGAPVGQTQQAKTKLTGA